MTQYPESGVKLVVDSKDYTTAMNEAIQLADTFDALGDLTISVSAEVDTSGVDSAIADLPLDGETVNFTVEADVQGDELDTLPTDGETVNTEVNIEETATAKETLGALNTIKNLKILETVWNITGTAVDAFKKFGEFAIEPMLTLDDAVARVNAQTDKTIPNARELISNIFYDDLGDSIDQVGKLVIKAAQLKAPVDEATRAALTFTHTFQDQNPEQVLTTLNNMVVGKLAPNFTEAGDLLVRAFQSGANKGGDLLTVLGDNATAIHDLGLTGPESLSFIKTGLDNGFKSAQQVVDVLLKIKQNVTNAAGNNTSDVSKTLDILGIANPAETGDAWSAEFFQGVIDAIKNAPGMSDTDKEALFSNLVGGKQGGKTFSAFLQLSPAEAKDVFANLPGAAAEAAQLSDDSLRGAIDDFSLAINKAVQDWLSSSAIDLPGKIAALKTGLQDALTTLSEGGSLSDALTVALKPIGFDDEFKSLESALGNFVIAILQAVAIAQDIAGQGQAAEGTRTVVGKMATTQLAFDLTIANPDDVATDIATATSRGLSSTQIADTVSGVIDELIKTGTADSMAQAQKLVDTLKAPVDQNKLPTLNSGAPMNVEPTVTDEALAGLQQQIDDFLLKNSPPAPVEQAQTDLLSAQTDFQNAAGITKDKTDALKTSSDAVAIPLTNQSTQTAVVTTNATQSAGPLKVQADTTKKVADNAKAAAPAMGSMSNEMSGIAANAPAAASGLSALNIAVQAIIATASTLDAASKASKTTGTGGDTTGTTATPAATGGSTTTQGIMAALNPFVQGGSGGGGGGKSFSVNNVNIVQSEAQADALGYRTSEQLRGMAGS